MEATKQWIKDNYKPDKSEHDIDWDKVAEMIDRRTEEVLVEFYKLNNPDNSDYARQIISHFFKR